ncbi:hypothetical protein [Shouchella miscanthi]|uniref:Uncharacterized protein n=1 Tax=Shouchella miscanthi TaxID=2598861 RepID=A0ABU6NFL0_9BACI|nr:hypothetical protein [Shouchella miscanthi]
MKELKWEKEVTYILEYGGNSHEEVYFVNGIDGRRYTSNDERILESLPGPTTFEATGNEFQVIKPELVAVRLVSENEYTKVEELLYHLPDVNRYLQCEYRTEGIYGNFGFRLLVY